MTAGISSTLVALPERGCEVVTTHGLSIRTLVLSPSIQRAGGIQRYTGILARALNEVAGAGNTSVIATSEPALNLRTGRPRLAVGARCRFALRALWETARRRPELVICTHLSLGPVARLICLATRRRYWIVLHGIEAWCELPYWKRIALFRADRLIVTSAFSQDRILERHAIPVTRIRCLPCALDQTLLSEKPAASSLSGYKTEGRRIVLTVARLDRSEQYKGHDVVLCALSSVITKVPNVTYMIVGDGDDRNRLERLAADMGLAEHVIFTGQIADSELATVYGQCEIFILPARTAIDVRQPKGEGFGIAMLEAMAFGKPVIGPSYGAPAEMIRSGENGLTVDPQSPASVAAALEQLLLNPETARAMGRAGTERVRKYYSYEQFRETLRRMLAAWTNQSEAEACES